MKKLFAIVVLATLAAGAMNRDYARIEDGRLVYAPDMLLPSLRPPTTADYAARGWLKIAPQNAPQSNGWHIARTGYDARDGQIWRVYEWAKDEPIPRRWTPLSLKRSAQRLGAWEQFKSFLMAANAYEDFVMAQIEAEADEQFSTLIAAARQQFGDELVDRILNGAEVE